MLFMGIIVTVILLVLVIKLALSLPNTLEAAPLLILILGVAIVLWIGGLLVE